MAQEDKSLWIVIVRKTLKGPLTTDQVRALLEKKYVSLNDTGISVDPTSKKPRSNWMLLRQFPEFEKMEETPTPAPGTPIPPPLNALAPIAPPRKEEAADDTKIPMEMIEILPEDLVARTSTMQKTEFDEIQEPDPTAPRSALIPKFDVSFEFSKTWMYGIVAAIFMSYFFFKAGPKIELPGGLSQPQNPHAENSPAAIPAARPVAPQARERASTNTASVPRPDPRRNTRVRDDRPANAVELPMSYMEDAIRDNRTDDSPPSSPTSADADNQLNDEEGAREPSKEKEKEKDPSKEELPADNGASALDQEAPPQE